MVDSKQVGTDLVFIESAEDLYENSPCGFASTYPDGTIVKVNQTLLSWLGYPRDQVVGRLRFQNLLSIGSQIFFETHLGPLLKMQGHLNEVSLDLKAHDRKTIPVLISAVHHKDAAGELLGNRFTFFDITDRKKYEQELLLARKKADQAAKAKADFLSMMSHEIRTPMNAIIGIANLLRETPLSAEQKEYVGLLSLSSDHLLQLINDILDFSKIESGRIVLEEKGCHLLQFIRRTRDALSKRAAEKGLTLEIEVDEKAPAFVSLDPLKITQILNNLLGNAIKFTERGRVTLRVEASDSFAGKVTLQFTVSDTGIGIPEAQLSHIFEEFTQADYEIGMKYGGSGLGLAICQKLLALYGSRLEVSSVPGQGSTFSFRIEVRIAASSDIAMETQDVSQDTETLKGLRLLVAEDNPSNVYVLSRFLKKWNIDFDVVTSGREAAARIEAHPYDLVLMDLQMPDTNGYEAARIVRSFSASKPRDIPIIALSASTRFGSEEQLESHRFNDFVGKPFRPEELFQKIAFHSGRLSAALPHTSRQDEAKMVPRTYRAKTSVCRDEVPSFKLDRYMAAIDHDPEALLELGPVTIQSYEAARHEFKKALQAGDREAFEFQAHKLAMTMELLEAEGLRTAIAESRECLEAKRPNPLEILSLIQRLQTEIDALIEGLRKAIQAAAGVQS